MEIKSVLIKIKETAIKIFGLISIFLFISFLLLFLFLQYSGYLAREDLKQNGKESIGKFVLLHKYKKGCNNFFNYYINGIKYQGNAILKRNGIEKDIGKFYKVRYSEKYKGCVEAFFDKEVKDTSEILNAGFTMKEIISIDSVPARESTIKDDIICYNRN